MAVCYTITQKSERNLFYGSVKNNQNIDKVSFFIYVFSQIT